MKHYALTIFSFAVLFTGCQKTKAQIQLKYLGAAGWVITNEGTKVLIDPYLSRIKLVGMSTSSKISNAAQNRDWGSDTRKKYYRDDRYEPDTTIINYMINGDIIDSNSYIFVHHTHFDHAADVPYIAMKTGARVIGTESLSNLLRAHGVPNKQIVTVKGGEDYDFEDFSVKVLPSLHSALRDKQYFSSEKISKDIKVPLQIKEYVEGGSLMFYFRFKDHKVLTMGSMNFIEKEIDGLKPDILLAGSANSRKEIYNYTERLLELTGFPKIVIPTHWDDFRVNYDAPQQKALESKALPFIEDIKATAPRTKIIIPEHLVPITIN
ncbi:MAG: MBL fold metallo-hydrolase [Candidatus Neomarinimicrobiota bacterium]|nr:MBL fold metallo-hydrolase [Candidatus Neomarinimicrobiota bacterium]MED5434169.1 MBL fold metallo-hydrolase [Candidatus Neomarinimicrobiota bacterium]